MAKRMANSAVLPEFREEELAPERTGTSTWPLALPGLLFCLTFAVFAWTTTFEFTNYDDGLYVYENPWVSSGLTWPSFLWAFTSLHGGVSYWHPITWLSHQLDCELFGLWAGAHHLTNVWLHVANTLLVFSLLQNRLSSRVSAFYAAAVFGIHPLHVESVAWVAERKDVLYGLFWLSALGCYVQHRRSSSRSWSWGALACFTVALMSKPTAVTLPFVLFCGESLLAASEGEWAFEPGCVGRWRRLIPFCALSLAIGILTVIAQTGIGALPGLSALSFRERSENAVFAYAVYLGKAIWPARLCASYIQTQRPSVVQVLLAALLIASISVFLWRHRRTLAVANFGWLWFLLCLLPNIGLIQAGPQAWADRYMYLPLLGLILMVCDLSRLVTHQPWITCGRVLLPILVLALATMSVRQLPHWANGVALFSRALAMNPDNWVAQLGLGKALMAERRFSEALPHLQNALLLPGNRPEAQKCLELCVRGLEDNARGAIAVEQACQRSPSRSSEPEPGVGNPPDETTHRR